MGDYETVFISDKKKASDVYSKEKANKKYHKVVQNRPEVYSVLMDGMKILGDWYELPDGMGLKTTWNFLWTWTKPKIDYST